MAMNETVLGALRALPEPAKVQAKGVLARAKGWAGELVRVEVQTTASECHVTMWFSLGATYDFVARLTDGAGQG